MYISLKMIRNSFADILEHKKYWQMFYTWLHVRQNTKTLQNTWQILIVWGDGKRFNLLRYSRRRNPGILDKKKILHFVTLLMLDGLSVHQGPKSIALICCRHFFCVQLVRFAGCWLTTCCTKRPQQVERSGLWAETCFVASLTVKLHTDYCSN